MSTPAEMPARSVLSHFRAQRFGPNPIAFQKYASVDNPLELFLPIATIRKALLAKNRSF